MRPDLLTGARCLYLLDEAAGLTFRDEIGEGGDARAMVTSSTTWSTNPIRTSMYSASRQKMGITPTGASSAGAIAIPRGLAPRPFVGGAFSVVLVAAFDSVSGTAWDFVSGTYGGGNLPWGLSIYSASGGYFLLSKYGIGGGVSSATGLGFSDKLPHVFGFTHRDQNTSSGWVDLYFDGRLSNGGALYRDFIHLAGSEQYLGAYTSGGAFVASAFQGTFFCFGFWDRALSAEDHAQLARIMLADPGDLVRPSPGKMHVPAAVVATPWLYARRSQPMIGGGL